jgi:hypothetical protein
LSECLSGVSIERFDSSALGSFPLSTELVEHSMDSDESPASAVRKSRKNRRWREKSTQHRNWRRCCDSASSNLAAPSAGISWHYRVDGGKRRHKDKHDGATINVPNFARSHFDEVDGVARRKTRAKQGALSSRVALHTEVFSATLFWLAFVPFAG